MQDHVRRPTPVAWKIAFRIRQWPQGLFRLKTIRRYKKIYNRVSESGHENMQHLSGVCFATHHLRLGSVQKHGSWRKRNALLKEKRTPSTLEWIRRLQLRNNSLQALRVKALDCFTTLVLGGKFQMKYEWAPPRTSSNVSSCSRENRALWLSSHLSWWVRRNSLNVWVTCGARDTCGRRSVKLFRSDVRDGVQQ